MQTDDNKRQVLIFQTTVPRLLAGGLEVDSKIKIPKIGLCGSRQPTRAGRKLPPRRRNESHRRGPRPCPAPTRKGTSTRAGPNLAEGLQTTKRALSHSRCHEECLERLGAAWKSTKGSESDAARRLIRRSENGRLTLGAPYAERLQTQVPTTKSWSEANVSSA